MPPKRRMNKKSNQLKRIKQIKSDLDHESDDDTELEYQNIAHQIKANQSKKLNKQNLEFEKKSNQLIDSIEIEIENKSSTYQNQMNKLFESVNGIEQELQTDSKRQENFKILLNRNFHTQISILSNILNELNSEKLTEQDQLFKNLQDKIDQRPKQLYEFSKMINRESKRSYKLHLQHHKLMADSREFRNKYHELIKTALS